MPPHKTSHPAHKGSLMWLNYVQNSLTPYIHAVYAPSEMRINESFNPISIRSAGGKVALDMSVFDDTTPSTCVVCFGGCVLFLCKRFSMPLCAQTTVALFNPPTEAELKELKQREMWRMQQLRQLSQAKKPKVLGLGTEVGTGVGHVLMFWYMRLQQPNRN